MRIQPPHTSKFAVHDGPNAIFLRLPRPNFPRFRRKIGTLRVTVQIDVRNTIQLGLAELSDTTYLHRPKYGMVVR